ncbi:MAG: HEAT repeat domain-containing protein [Leptolyngbya sp.]|nr:HEAT repeat domain-containing protein [Candidatus Melainabacteria bacterium]
MSYDDFLSIRNPKKALATATDDDSSNSSNAEPGTEANSNNLLSEVFGNRKERTLAGNVIGSVRDAFSSNLTEEEKTKRAESNDFMATIAADTAAMMSRRVAVGGLIRAGMMADTKGDGRDFALGFVKDGLEGVGLNYLGKMASPGSNAFKFAESRLGVGLKQEMGMHAGTGAMFGVLKAGSDPNAWRDQAGHFSFQSGLNNLTDWKKLTTAGLTGAVINVPAGMVGFRIAKSSTVAVANRTGSEAFGTVVGGVLSGSGSGALFGGLDAAMHGKSLKEIGASTLDGMYIGAATGGAMSGWHAFRPSNKPILENTTEAKPNPTGKALSEERLALAPKDDHKLPSDRREIETQGELFWTIKAEKWYSQIHFEAPPKPALVDLHRMIKRTEIVDYDIRRVNDDPNIPDKFENWAEFSKWTHVAKERAVVFKVEGINTKIIVPEASEKLHNEIRRLRHLAEIDAPSFDNLDGAVRIELQQHAMAGNIKPLLARFGIKAETIAQIIRARVELNTNPLYRRALPEDFIPALKELPNPNLVKELVLLEEPSFADKYHRKADDGAKRTAAAATASDDGKITFFETNNTLPKGSTSKGVIREFLSHEWAHLLKHKYAQHSSLFNEAAEFETGFYAREYAKRQYPDHPSLKHHENFAVHLGENLMMPDADSFFTTANHAPIRTTIMAKAMLESMLPGKEVVVHPADFTARIAKIPETMPNREKIVARLNYIAEEIVPIARQKLLEQAASGALTDRLRASMLLGRIGHPSDVPEAHRIATQAFDSGLRKSLFDSMANISSVNMDARVKFMVGQAKPGMPLREEALTALQTFQHPDAKNFYEVYSLVGKETNLPRLIEAMENVSNPAAKKVAFDEIVSLAAPNVYGEEFINAFLIKTLRTQPSIRLDVLNYASRRLNSTLEPELMRLQRAADPDVAERAKGLLQEVRTKKILENSQRWLHGDDAERKYEAIQELAWLGDNRAVPILLRTVVTAPPKWSNEAIAALRHYSPNIIQAHAHDLQRNGYPALLWGDIQNQLRLGREPFNQPFLQQAASRRD